MNNTPIPAADDADEPDPAWVARIEDLGIGSLIKLVLGVVGLIVMLVFVSLLPGVGRDIPGLPITYAAFIGVWITLAIVVVLLRIGSRARRVIQQLDTRVKAVNRLTAAVVFWSIIFFALVIAHEGFAGAAGPILQEIESLWAYDLAFFGAGVAILLVIGFRFFQLIDPLAELFMQKLHSDSESANTIQTTLPVDVPDRSDK